MNDNQVINISDKKRSLFSKRVLVIIFFAIFIFGSGIAVLLIRQAQSHTLVNINIEPVQTVQTTSETQTKEIQPEPTPEPEPKEIKLLMMGDTALLDPLGPMVLANPNYTPLEKMKPFFDQFDYKVATLEATIDGASVGSPNPGKGYTFSTPKESVRIFKEAGINALFYGGNHVRDYGPESVTHTIQLLNDGGLGSFGSGKDLEDSYKPLIVDIRGTKVAFLGYNCMEYAFNHATYDTPGTASFSVSRANENIGNAKLQADVVVVFMHAGNEHDFTPDPEWQVKWAKVFADAGADIVIGGHPHVIQEDTIVDGVPVFYSIGNFMFPGMAWDPNAQKGQLVEIVITDKKIKEIKKHEILMDQIGVPSLVY